MTRQLKVTYTILNAWKEGRYEDAVKHIFNIPTPKTPAMIAGSKYHEEWEDEIRKTKKLPVIFGSKILIDPKPEQYIKVRVSEWLILSGKIDCYDKPTIYEFKTGKQTSEDVIKSYQPGIYAVLSTLNKQYADRCEIHCYNQHLKNDNKTMSIKYLTDDVLKDTLNWIETLASEILCYLEDNKLFDRFTQRI